jgi:MHS family citrate/tricarballylate:H+ symporter-like MFS transporter
MASYSGGGELLMSLSHHPQRTGAVTIAIGNVLLHYAIVLIAFSSGILSDVFLPGRVFGSSIWLTTLVAPLVGAVAVGRVADRVGRRPGLFLSFVLVGIGALGIAVTPSYPAIGISASVLFLFFRMLLFLALGGSFGVIAAMLIELATPARRGLFASIFPATSALSMVFALLLLTGMRSLIGAEALRVWGWRVAFFIGATILPYALLLWRELPETLNNSEPEARVTPNWRYFFFLGSVVFAGLLAAQYEGNFFTGQAGLGNVVMLGNLVGIYGVVFSPIGGWLSDKQGIARIMVGSFAVLVGLIIAYIVLVILTAPAGPGNTISVAVVVLIDTLNALVFPATIVAVNGLFAPHTRCQAVGIANAAASTTILVLVGQGGRPLLMGDVIDMALICVVGLFAMGAIAKRSALPNVN